jgi:hypothetical protein
VAAISTAERIAEFKQAVAADLYAATDIVDIRSAEDALDEVAIEIDALQAVVNSGIESANLASVLLRYPRSYTFLCSILSVGGEIELEDGRKLPEPSKPPRSLDAATSTAMVLLDLGIRDILTPGSDVRKLWLVVQIAQDAANRRFRVDRRMQSRIGAAVKDAIEAVNSKTEWSLEEVPDTSIAPGSRGLIEHVVAVNGIPRIAVASTFQAYTGGRQTREMTSLYPDLQRTLSKSQIELVLIAEGRGMKALPERVLHTLFSAVPRTMSLREAEGGRLSAAFEELAPPPPEPSIDAAGLRQIIASALSQRSSVSATALPADIKEAQRALASYASEAVTLDLILAPDASSLAWRRADILARLRSASLVFDAPVILEGLIELLGGTMAPLPKAASQFSAAVATIQDDTLFETPFVVGAQVGSFALSSVRAFAKEALGAAADAKAAVLVTSHPLSSSAVLELRRAQALLPVNVIVVDGSTVLSMAQLKESPRQRLRTLSLEQSDLTKISPFVVRSVTPKQAFFGREEEENTLISTLPTNSVALLGGRRIGKTSLMQHCFDRLEGAGLKPFFADCQVVKTWANFGTLARREWDVDVPEAFRPDNLFDVIKQLRGEDCERIVVMLDEIDQLLSWDKSHEEDEVPEAFFRACRAISQQDLAQFVFSGERTIATTMWDASSPHWNFCRPMMLQQLTRSAADQLISYSMNSLGVRLEEESNVLAACWTATDGHPELLQLVGDKLVSLINQRDRADVFVTPADVLEVTNSYEYAEQYLETYWGQSTLQERIISLMIVEEDRSVDQISVALDAKKLTIDVPDLQTALRMLELYGIVAKWKKGYKLKAHWFRTALSYYGGIESTAKRYKAMLANQ